MTGNLGSSHVEKKAEATIIDGMVGVEAVLKIPGRADETVVARLPLEQALRRGLVEVGCE